MLPLTRYGHTRREQARSIWMCSCLSLALDLAQWDSSILIATSLDVCRCIPLPQPWPLQMPALSFKGPEPVLGLLLKRQSSRLAPLHSLLPQGSASTTSPKGWLSDNRQRWEHSNSLLC